jgi:hypothetical protein
LLSAVALASSDVVVVLAYLKVKLFLLLVELEAVDDDEVDDEVGSDPVPPGSRGPPTCAS